MEETVLKLYHTVISVLGSGEELIDECETTTSYAISELHLEFKGRVIKVEGTFEGKGHFWCEVDNQIIDLSVEQFGYVFQFPVSNEREMLYVPKKESLVDEKLHKESTYLSEISGL